ncbi:DUF4183 domain-containing protein (plasmid) [Pseudalkalibacillus hwajinpoensis]|uniref:DUF4183 domain-containing protein n=1 Tax=Guptibacillus hwajinpoensis TaxID=208199 RepID=UPI00325B0D3F
MNDNLSKNKQKQSPLFTFPELPKKEVRYVCPKRVKVFEYYTMSTGSKRVFMDNDSLSNYGPQKILSPTLVSYMSLFINAVLQPPATYTVKEGKIILHTKDIPLSGTPIILQMIKVE